MTGIGTTVCDLLAPSRVEILIALANEGKSSRELAEVLKMGRNPLGRQINMLKARGLIYSEKVNHAPLYRLTGRGERVVQGLKAIANA